MIKFITLLAISLSVFAQTPDSPEANLLKKEAEVLWEKRDSQEELEQMLAKLESAHALNTQDRETLERLSHGYFLLADQHLSNEALMKRAYEKGREWGLKGMNLNAEFKERLKSKSIKNSVDKLTDADVPSMFWTLANTGKWSKLNGIFSSLKYKDEILAILGRVEELRPNYFHSAVPRYWGGFYALAPGIAGGDMKKSKEKFKEAMEKSPDYLGTKVLYAELYLVKKDDKKEFEKVLTEVVNAQLGPRELHPENRLEKKKAAKLLEKKDEIF